MTTNYQVAGDGAGWNTRSIKMQNLSPGVMDHIFALAQAGTDQVPCLWDHLPENYLADVTFACQLIQASAAKYPGVSFRFCTAVEAMQRWLGVYPSATPGLDVSPSVQGDTLSLNVSVNQPIFQAQPFVAVRDVLQHYQIVPCQPVSTNSWMARVPMPFSQIAKVGVAVTDPPGNLATRILRYLPDDLYLDNLDPEYTEVAGSWAPSPTFAWGTDARMALLGSNDTATVQWSLPITWTGHYNLFAQVPTVTNAAGQVAFTVLSGGSNTVARFRLAALPSGQWVYLGSPFLDSMQSNVLQMTVSGSNQPNACAVADVIRAAPVVAVPPEIESPTLVGTTFSVSVATQFGLDYFLEYRNSFTDAAWTTVQSVSGNGTLVVLTDSAANTAARFYRILVQWH